jgi:hypothetical protein
MGPWAQSSIIVLNAAGKVAPRSSKGLFGKSAALSQRLTERPGENPAGSEAFSA